MRATPASASSTWGPSRPRIATRARRISTVFCGLLALLLRANFADALDEAPPLFDRRGERVLRIWPQPTEVYGNGAPTIAVVSPSGASMEGNITVLVSGSGFRNFGDVKVRFCHVEARGYVINEGTITTVAPPLSRLDPSRTVPGTTFTAFSAETTTFDVAPGQSHACRVRVSLNGVDFTRESPETFTYYNLTSVSIAKMRPSGGPVAGGTPVTLDGVGFLDLGGGVQGPKCRFGDIVVAATVTSHQTAHCVSPRQSEPVPVWLTLNGYTDERSLVGGMTFRYSAPPTLSELHPIGGPSAGGAFVTVHGHGFVDDGEATSSCPIGDDLLCTAHQKAMGIRLAEEPRTGFQCVFGARGATDSVTVTGTLMEGGNDALLCQTPTGRVLERLATGNVGAWCDEHGNTTRCLDPAYATSALTAVEIRVTTNANASAASPTAVVYMPLAPHLPTLQNIQPWGGPPHGGTVVHIVGEELLSLTERTRPLCRFGHTEVLATVGGQGGSPGILSSPLHDRVTLHDARSPRTVAVHSGRLLTCISPPGREFRSRWIRVSVALDGEHFSHDTLSFRYTDFALSRVYPSGGFLAGGTMITVHGRGFTDFGGLRCVFGAVSVPATKVEARSLHCISPKRHEPIITNDPGWRVPLSVSLNGDLDSSSLQYGNATFSYFDPASVVVSSLSPAQGPVTGGIDVTLRGTGFAEYGMVQCRFGQHDAVNASYPLGGRLASTTPLASGISLTELVCKSPAHPLGPNLARDGGDAVHVALSLTGVPSEFTVGGPTFFYHHPCRGRELLDFYDTAGARTAVSRYLSFHAPNLTEFDVDGDGRLDTAELRAAIFHQHNNYTLSATPTDDALRNYAESTCFLHHEANGRELSRADDPRAPSDGLFLYDPRHEGRPRSATPPRSTVDPRSRTAAWAEGRPF